MVANILDGRALSKAIQQTIKLELEGHQAKALPRPGLAVILIGNDPASNTYVRHKVSACKNVGIYSIVHRLPDTITQEELVAHIHDCARDPTIHGILLQLPLPTALNADALLEHIPPEKDVDGFHPYNLGRLVQRRPILRPCTPHGVIQLLQTTGHTIAGKHAVVVGASNIVGRPMALELLLEKCTITVCHRFTKNLAEQIQQADILVAALGNPGIIQTDWIKPGSIVIDIGFNHLPDGSISGDIHFASAKEKAAWITPVPGGVGPMTVAALLQNTMQAANLQHKKEI